MSYLVMECHHGYAVVLAEDGSFQKVANLRYEVGQTVTDVVPVTLPARKPLPVLRYCIAACLVLLLTPLFLLPQLTYASVYLTINPQVRIDVNRSDEVLRVEGINAEGIALAEGYNCAGKPLDLVVDELVDQAIAAEYLHTGGTVTVGLETTHENWRTAHTTSIKTHLEEHLRNILAVSVDVDSHWEDHEEEDDHEEPEDCDEPDDHEEPEDCDDPEDHDAHDDDDEHHHGDDDEDEDEDEDD